MTTSSPFYMNTPCCCVLCSVSVPHMLILYLQMLQCEFPKHSCRGRVRLSVNSWYEELPLLQTLFQFCQLSTNLHYSKGNVLFFCLRTRSRITCTFVIISISPLPSGNFSVFVFQTVMHLKCTSQLFVEYDPNLNLSEGSSLSDSIPTLFSKHIKSDVMSFFRTQGVCLSQ